VSDDKRNDTDPATLTGAFALNALTPEQRADFEAKLDNSESLRHEVTELADTAVVLGLAVAPIDPPPALKASIMGLIASMPQLPALETQASSSADAGASVTDIASRQKAVSDTPVQTSTPVEAPAETPASRKAQSRWFTKPAIVLAGVAAAVGLIAGGGVLVNTVGDANTQQVQADALAAITSAEDSQQAAAEVAGGGTAKLVWSNSLGSSAVMVDGLASLDSGKVYELWYIDDEGARAAGTFTVGDSGSTWRVLDGEMHAGDLVGVTVEPAGGSEQPTTDPIVAIQSA
jgi:anti-sigma-K factor RskA